GIADRQHRDFGAEAIVDEIRTELISGGVESGMVESIVRRAEKQFNPADGDVQTALRMIVATSAVSHGVDVENFNSMFFAGMPTAIDEFIQASSRVGRIHVGFSMLIPTPQNQRDRFIFEVHEPFHRFLERMIAPPAIERWADRAILRIIPSLVQNWLIGKIYQEQFAEDEDPTKKRIRIFSKVTYVRSLVNRMRAMEFIDELERYILDCIGLDAIHGGAQSQRQTITMLVRERIREFVRLLEMPTADGDLSDFWEEFRANIDSPMTSLRDVDAPGTVRPYVDTRKHNAKERFTTVMRFIREGGVAAAQDVVEVQSELRND
ncbi:MAG: helicase C-terminal domain-containing protein, partial [Xanthobacteraceae bacterium]